jgi:hypothetical protein
MNVAEAIAFSALMIGIVSGAGVWLDAYKRRLTNRERELELQAQIASAGLNDGQVELAGMEQRLRVLERIATDRKHMLADEIEALRGDLEKAQ